jgi:hypothetical protein
MKTNFLFLLFLTIILGFISCSKENESPIQNLHLTENRSLRSSGRTDLIKDISAIREKGKFNNPYYVGNKTSL